MIQESLRQKTQILWILRKLMAYSQLSMIPRLTLMLAKMRHLTRRQLMKFLNLERIRLNLPSLLLTSKGSCLTVMILSQILFLRANLMKLTLPKCQLLISSWLQNRWSRIDSLFLRASKLMKSQILRKVMVEHKKLSLTQLKTCQLTIQPRPTAPQLTKMKLKILFKIHKLSKSL